MDLRSNLVLSSYQTSHVLDLYETNDIENLDLNRVVKIKEFQKLNITLNGNDGDYFEMPEMHDYYIPDRTLNVDGHYQYPENTTVVLFQFGKSETSQEVPLVPGLYTIISKISGKTFFSYFSIVPKDLSIPDWHKMKEEVNGAISGLAIDYYKRRNFDEIDTRNTSEYADVSMNKINFFLEKERELRFVLEKLRHEARYKIGKTHHWEPNGAKNVIDSTTIRKMSERPDKKGMVFSAKRYLEYDVPENRWAKMILHSFLDFSKQAIQNLELTKLNLLEDRKKHAKYDNKRKRSNVYFQDNRLKTHLENIDNDINRFSQLSSYFYDILKDDFLNQNIGKINKSIPKALVLNPNYNFLYKLFTELKTKKDTPVLADSYTYVWKSTEILYEIWTYIQSIQALIQLGYYPDNGWIFSSNPLEEVLPQLNDNETVTFTHDNGEKIRLVFNSEIPRTGHSTMEQPLRTDARRNKPDIRIDMFDEVDDYAGSILVDAKYKKLMNVLKQNNNNVMDQFREYKKSPYVSNSYWHIHEYLKSRLMPVQAVIVLYPKNDGTSIKTTIVEQNILLTELNPHSGIDEYVSILGEQLEQIYATFKNAKTK